MPGFDRRGFLTPPFYKRDNAVLAFFASLNASTASEAKNVPPIHWKG